LDEVQQFVYLAMQLALWDGASVIEDDDMVLVFLASLPKSFCLFIDFIEIAEGSVFKRVSRQILFKILRPHWERNHAAVSLDDIVNDGLEVPDGLVEKIAIGTYTVGWYAIIFGVLTEPIPVIDLVAV
jgi:hypothetical protein